MIAIDRKFARDLLYLHIRMQSKAQLENSVHSTKNDINDQLIAVYNKVVYENGQIEGERFLRLYAEEQLALERDGPKRMETILTDLDKSLITNSLQITNNSKNNTKLLAIYLIIAISFMLLVLNGI